MNPPVIFLLKETSVFSAVSIMDLMFTAKDLIGLHYNTKEALLLLVVFYLLILLPISNASEPLPTVERTKTGALIHWPNGKTDSVSFVPGKNGKEVVWERK